MWSSRGLGHRQHPPSSAPRGLTTSSHPRRRFFSRAPAAAAGEGDAAPAPGAGDAVDCVRITRLSGSDVGALSDVLRSLGATCCTVEDADLGTDDELELYAGDEKVWHRCDVTAMFAPGEDVDAIMADAQDILDSEIAYRRENIPGDDWVGVVLDSFEPVRVADGIWIVPEWTTQTEDPDAIDVVLEPGLAFGTGEHPHGSAACSRGSTPDATRPPRDAPRTSAPGPASSPSARYSWARRRRSGWTWRNSPSRRRAETRR